MRTVMKIHFYLGCWAYVFGITHIYEAGLTPGDGLSALAVGCLVFGIWSWVILLPIMCEEHVESKKCNLPKAQLRDAE